MTFLQGLVVLAAIYSFLVGRPVTGVLFFYLVFDSHVV